MDNRKRCNEGVSEGDRRKEWREEGGSGREC